MENSVETPKVTKPGVMKAVKTGLKFVFSMDKELMGMVGWYAVVAFVVTLLVQQMVMTHSDWVVMGVMILVQLPLTVWAVTKTLTGEGGTKFFGWYSKDVTWRVLGAALIAAVIMAVPVVFLVGAMFVLMGAVSLGSFLQIETLLNLPQMGAGVMAVVGVVLLVIAFLGVRFSFVVPFTVDTNKVNVFGAFRATGGAFWRVMGVMLLTMVVAFLVTFVVGMLLGFLGSMLLVLMPGVPVLMVVVKTIAMAVQSLMGLATTVAMASLYKEKKMLEG